jgi:hypothetical protein
MDKTADDWKGYKSSNTHVQDELHSHSKSANKYLERQAFLKKAELSEFEQQKQGRLADSRGRT